MKYSLRISWGPQNKDIIVAQVADFFSGQWSSVTWAQDTGWRQFYFHNGWADSGQVLLLPTHLPLKGHKWHPQDFCCCCWAHPNSYICWVCKVLLTSSAMWITKDLLRNYDMLKSIFNLNCESFLILAIVRRPVSCFLQSATLFSQWWLYLSSSLYLLTIFHYTNYFRGCMRDPVGRLLRVGVCSLSCSSLLRYLVMYLKNWHYDSPQAYICRKATGNSACCFFLQLTGAREAVKLLFQANTKDKICMLSQ